jgi:hypothetical protein
MRAFKPTTGKTSLIGIYLQRRFSPWISRQYARLGFANRQRLANNLQNTQTTDHDLLLDRLTSQGILKEDFRPQVNTASDIQEHMISGRVTPKKLNSFNQLNGLQIETDPLFESKVKVISTLSTGVVAGCETAYRGLLSGDSKVVSWSMAIAKGTIAAAGIGWFIGMPPISTLGTVLTTGTAAGVLSTMYSHRLPAESMIKKAALFTSRKTLPFFALVSGGYIMHLITEANMRISGIFNSIGLEGTTVCLIGLFALVRKFVKTTRTNFENSYTGQLDPGRFKTMRRMTTSAALSISADFTFIGVFTALVGAASYFIVGNVAAYSTLALLPFAVPVVATGAMFALRGSKRLAGEVGGPKTTKLIDHLKIYGAMEGLGLGFLSALASGTFFLPIAYLTFYGSLATLLASQAHGVFHSINTNQGQIPLMRTSGRDIFGEQEIRQLNAGKTTLVENPATGIVEFTSGNLFSRLLARKPHIRYHCKYDLILTQLSFHTEKAPLKDRSVQPELIARAKEVLAHLEDSRYADRFVDWVRENQDRILDFENDGQIRGFINDILPNFRNFTEQKHFLKWSAQQQAAVFDRLNAGVNGQASLNGKYTQLITNLEATAAYYDGELNFDIQKKYKGLLTRSDFNHFGRRGEAIWNALLRSGYLAEVSDGVAQVQRKSVTTRGEFEKNIPLLAGELDPVFEVVHQTIRIRRWFEMFEGKFNWFSEEIPEYTRANLEELAIRADDFRKTAKRLKAKLERGQISEADFYREWSHEIGCFDPDMTNAVSTNRKELEGDEWKVRKVENVATATIMNGLVVYKMWYTESDVYPTTNWVTGNWTQVYNPHFKYNAQPGTLEGSKFLWIKAEKGLNDYQKNHRKHLSTSPIVRQMVNTPTEGEGFRASNRETTINLWGKDVTVTDFYYVAGENQSAIPSVKDLRYREGHTSLPKGYSVATRDNPKDVQLEPVSFALPHFDDVVMMDKNDVQVDTYSLLPAIIRRDAQDLYLNLMYRHKVSGDFKIKNPHPEKELDTAVGLILYDHNVELTYVDPTTNRRSVIPLLLDRTMLTKGIDESAPWKNLSGAEITMQDGKATSFAVVYGNQKVYLPESKLPRFAGSLDIPAERDGEVVKLGANNFTKHPFREGDMTWIKISYTDGTHSFVRATDGKRPILFNKDRN